LRGNFQQTFYLSVATIETSPIAIKQISLYDEEISVYDGIFFVLLDTTQNDYRNIV